MAARTMGYTLARPIIEEIREVTGGQPVVVAFSGGLDSSTVAALAKEALGPERVLLVTVNMGMYNYRRGNEIVLEMAEQLGLRQRCLLGQYMQDRIQRFGPACNRCTREIKLGMVKRAAQGRLVLTGANRSDTWGQMGLKVLNGFYAPLLEYDKPQIRQIAQELGITPPRIGESPGREGCKLKHLLKPLVNPEYHGRAVAEANEAILSAIRSEGWPAELANVKVIGPLSRNIGLVNLRPLPPEPIRSRILREIQAIPFLEEVHLVETPLRLVIKASPAITNDPHARYWVHHGRLAPDFAFPIAVEWIPSTNNRLHTFHVVAFAPIQEPVRPPRDAVPSQPPQWQDLAFLTPSAPR